MKITKKQKQQLIDLNDSRVNKILDLGLKVGEWYKATDSKFMVLLTKFNSMYDSKGYFFDTSGDWKGFGDVGLGQCIKATPQEIDQALTDEAKRRGFNKGVKFKSLSENGKIRTISDKTYICYYIDLNSLTILTSEEEWDNKYDVQSNPTIFKDGEWAEIIDENPEQNKVTIDIRFPYTRDKQKHEVFIIEELEDNQILVEFKNKERLISSKDCIVIE